MIQLDDIQWSDAGSLYLLERILCSTGFGSLVLIASWRREEGSGRSLARLLDKLSEHAITPEVLSLRPLDSASARGMLADALRCTEEKSRPWPPTSRAPRTTRPCSSGNSSIIFTPRV